MYHMAYPKEDPPIQEVFHDDQPIRDFSNDINLFSRQETGPSCPIIRVTVMLENGSMATSVLPHFYIVKLQPGSALTVCTCPEADVEALYLPPGFCQNGNRINIPDAWMPSQMFFMICKIKPKGAGEHCSFPILIHGIWDHVVSSDEN